VRHRVERGLCGGPGRPEQLWRLRHEVRGRHVLLGSDVRRDLHRAHIDALRRHLRRLAVRQQELRLLRQRVPRRPGLLGRRVRSNLRFHVCDVRSGRHRLLRPDEPRPRQLRRLRHRLHPRTALLRWDVRRQLQRIDDALQRPVRRYGDRRLELRRLRDRLRGRHLVQRRQVSRPVLAVLRRRQRLWEQRRLWLGRVHGRQVCRARVRTELHRRQLLRGER